LKNEMSNGSESSKPPCLHKLVHLMPTVKTDAKRIALENSENLSECRLKPICLIADACDLHMWSRSTVLLVLLITAQFIGYSLTIAGYILCNVRRVS
jgi:hypothetical protein